MENQTISQQNNNQEMERLSTNELMKRLESLPDKIQKILLSDELADYFLELERQNNLNLSQADIMIGTTHNVLLGVINPHVFLPILSGELIDNGVNPIVAKDIAQKIESKFITPIREDLDKIYHRFKAMESLEKETEIEKEEKPVSTAENQNVPSVAEAQKQSATEEAVKEGVKPIVIKPEESEIKPEELPKEITKTEELKPEEKREPLIEIKSEKPAEKIETPSVVQKTTPQPQKRSFFSFLKFKRPEEKIENQPAQPVIIGKESEVKPVLDKESPWVISFEDVKPSKEKVISEVEIKTEPEIKPIAMEKPLEPLKTIEPIKKDEIPVKPLETKEEKQPSSSTTQIGPIKIVDYTAEKPKEEMPKEEAKQPIKTDSSINLTSTPELNKPISEEIKQQPEIIKIPSFEKKEEKKEEEKVESININQTPANTPSQMPQLQENQPISPETIQKESIKGEEKESAPKEETTNIPAENVIDLRKLKF